MNERTIFALVVGASTAAGIGLGVLATKQYKKYKQKHGGVIAHVRTLRHGRAANGPIEPSLADTGAAATAA